MSTRRSMEGRCDPPHQGAASNLALVRSETRSFKPPKRGRSPDSSGFFRREGRQIPRPVRRYSRARIQEWAALCARYGSRCDETGMDRTPPDREATRFGPYRVFEKIGQGGMCLVLRARKDQSPRDCALKVLRADRRGDDRLEDLFTTESDLALLVEHPNLIHTYETGDIDGRSYIAMELIEGGTLQQLVTAAAQRRIPIPLDVALFIISEVLEGLHALHQTRGVSGRPLELVHRDVSPQNIFLSYDGRVILGDLGVAMVRAHGPPRSSEVLGKLGYLAPEMVSMGDVDRRADLFAIGVVAYQLLTGVPPFTGKTQEDVLTQIAGGRFVPARRRNPAIRRELDEVFSRALTRRPEDRFDTAEALVHALERFWSKKLANPFLLAALIAAVHECPRVDSAGRPTGSRRSSPRSTNAPRVNSAGRPTGRTAR